MSLYAAMLGEVGRPLGWLLEGMLTSQVASALARLGVADELAGDPLTAAQLALRVGAAPDALSRLLSAAAVYGLVRKDTAGRFALTPAGDLLRTAADGSARGVAVGFLSPPLWQSAGRLAEIIRNPMMMVLGGRERSRAEHEALLAPEGYALIRDTPLTEVLPWRVLEFERR